MIFIKPFRIGILLTKILIFIASISIVYGQNIKSLASSIINEQSDEAKLKLQSQISSAIKLNLSNDLEIIQPLDSTALLFELISDDQKIQIITWAIQFGEDWQYYGFIKSYNQLKKVYHIWELTPGDFIKSLQLKTSYNADNWPAGIYTQLIETYYKKRKVYTVIGWLAPDDQTSHKFLEVITIGKNGKPYFGKTTFFSVDKKYYSRFLFSYNSMSKFLLDYGEYTFTEKLWNRKKKKYDVKSTDQNMIVFDHLIPMYPDLKDQKEFLVPSGNIVDAFSFEKGKWRLKHDIDARNIKQKAKVKIKPQLNLFPDE